MNQRPSIAILGVGSVRSGPPILASLATFRSDDGVDVRLYDGDDERLDLMDRLARTLFSVSRAAHRLTASTDLGDALEPAPDAAILCAGANCARHELEPQERPKAIGARYPRFPDVPPPRPATPRSRLIERWLRLVGERMPPTTALASTMRASALPAAFLAETLDWPPPLNAADRRQRPHQVLRWIHGDDTVLPLIEAHEHSPVVLWLERLHLADGP